MILSEHDTVNEAIETILSALESESKELTQHEVERLRSQGINTVTVEEAIKGMSSEELNKFLEERQRKFVAPILDANIRELDVKKRRIKLRRIK